MISMKIKMPLGRLITPYLYIGRWSIKHASPRRHVVGGFELRSKVSERIEKMGLCTTRIKLMEAWNDDAVPTGHDPFGIGMNSESLTSGTFERELGLGSMGARIYTHAVGWTQGLFVAHPYVVACASDNA